MNKMTVDNSSSDTKRIAIIEDDSIVADHFTEIVNAADRYELVAIASSLAAAREELHLEPDLYLLDLGLPDGSGLEFIPEIKAACDARILIVTSFGDRETVVSALSAGADGYLLKDSEPIAIIDGIELTLQGGAPISAPAAVYLLERLRTSSTEAHQNDVPADPLSPREAELLKLFAKGCRYKETARILGISPLTVGNHVKSIYRKLAVTSRSEAVYEALAAGYIKI